VVRSRRWTLRSLTRRTRRLAQGPQRSAANFGWGLTLGAAKQGGTWRAHVGRHRAWVRRTRRIACSVGYRSRPPRVRAPHTHTRGGAPLYAHSAIAGASSQHSCAVTSDQSVWSGGRLEMQHRLRGCQLAAQLRGNPRSPRYWDSLCTHASSRYAHHSPLPGFPVYHICCVCILLRAWLYIATLGPVN